MENRDIWYVRYSFRYFDDDVRIDATKYLAKFVSELPIAFLLRYCLSMYLLDYLIESVNITDTCLATSTAAAIISTVPSASPTASNPPTTKSECHRSFADILTRSVRSPRPNHSGTTVPIDVLFSAAM